MESPGDGQQVISIEKQTAITPELDTASGFYRWVKTESGLHNKQSWANSLAPAHSMTQWSAHFDQGLEIPVDNARLAPHTPELRIRESLLDAITEAQLKATDTRSIEEGQKV